MHVCVLHLVFRPAHLMQVNPLHVCVCATFVFRPPLLMQVNPLHVCLCATFGIPTPASHAG